jgi:hypothetical protein
VLHSFDPRCVVIAGGGVGNDDVARWAYRVRAAAGPLPVLLFHRGIEEPVRTTGARHLSALPTEASGSLLEMLEDAQRDAMTMQEVEEKPLVAVESRRRWETA